MRLQKHLLKKAVPCVMAGTMLMQSFPMPVLAVQTESQDVGYGEASAGTQRDALVKTSKDSEFTVTVPKTIILDSNDAADYTVKVRGSVLADESVSVAPHDDMDTVDGVNFSMAESSGKKADAVATAVQNDTVWSSSEITADGTTKPGSISAEGITAGSWEGNLTFDINMDGSGSGGGNEDPNNPDNPDETHKHTYVDGVCSDCGEESTIASMPTFSNLRSGGTYPVGTSITCPEGTTLAIDGNETQTDENGVYVFNEVGEYSVLVDYGTSTVNVASAKALNVKGATRNYTPAGATVEMDITIAENPTMNVSNMVNNGTYPEGTKVAVDEGGSLKVNDTETNTEGGSYTLPGTGDYKIEVTDGQGNVYIVNITVNNISMGETEQPITKEAGLYTKSGTLLASWGRLTDTGWDISTSDTSKGNAFKQVLTQVNPDNLEFELVIPNTITNIGNYAFYDCTNLVAISIPNTVTSLGSYAFYGCTKLSAINIPDSVTSYGSTLFQGCEKLSNVKLSNNASALSQHMFRSCTSLKNIDIPSCVSSANASFMDCSSLESIDFSKCVTWTAGCDNSFVRCSSLKSVKLPEGTTLIGSRCFSNCTQLTDLYIPSSVTRIMSNAFENCSNLNLIVPNTVTQIDTDAFKTLKQVTYNGTATGEPWGAESIIH